MSALPDTMIHRRPGRELSWCEYGDPDGTLLFQFHGMPGSRFQRYFDEGAYARHRFRMILVDRPGYGRSTRRPGATLEDFASDIGSLADALGAERFAVCGWSAGSAHALAAAALLGPRVLACAALVPPFFPGSGIDRRAGLDADGLAAADAVDRGEPAVRAHYERIAERWLRELAAGRAPFPVPPPAVPVALQWMPEAFVQGADGVVDEALALARPWGIDLGAIRVPSTIWSAIDDTVCPYPRGEFLAGAIPGAELFSMTGGHLAFLPRYAEILARLRADVDRRM